jgi:MFS family permease
VSSTVTPAHVSASPADPRRRLRAAAVGSAFLLNGLTFGAWAARIPAVQSQTHLDEAGLGFALFGAAIGAVLTMSTGGWLGGRFGTHVVTPATMVLCGAMMPLIGCSWDFLSLTLFLCLYGVSQGTMDVCMNANGLAVERAGAGPIMSRLHATWSIGCFSGALISAQVAALGIPVLPQFTVIGLAMAGTGVVLFRVMLPDRHAQGGGRLRLPGGRLALLGALALVGLLAEGSATDWSGVYVRRSLGASEGMAALAVAAFSGAMAVARLVGDRLTVMVGGVRLVRAGATLSAVGLGLALAVPSPLSAIVGFGIMGAGLAAVVPTIFRAAGSQPGIPSSVGIGAVTTMGYAGGLIGPPIIGTIARATSLRVSLALVLIMLAILALAARRALGPTVAATDPDASANADAPAAI